MSTLSDGLAAKDKAGEEKRWDEDTESLALDWIAKVLPWLKGYKSLLCDDDPECRFHIEELTALIAEVEGTGKGGEG